MTLAEEMELREKRKYEEGKAQGLEEGRAEAEAVLHRVGEYVKSGYSFDEAMELAKSGQN